MQPSKIDEPKTKFSGDSQPNTSLSPMVFKDDDSEWTPAFDSVEQERSVSTESSNRPRPKLKRSLSSLNLFDHDDDDDEDVTDKIAAKKSERSFIEPPQPKRLKQDDFFPVEGTQEFVIRTGTAVKRVSAQDILDLMESIRILTSQVQTLSSENVKLWRHISDQNSKIDNLESLIQALIHDNNCLNLKLDHLAQTSSSSSPRQPSSPTLSSNNFSHRFAPDAFKQDQEINQDQGNELRL